jgi:hypothetical protein
MTFARMAPCREFNGSRVQKSTASEEGALGE